MSELSTGSLFLHWLPRVQPRQDKPPKSISFVKLLFLAFCTDLRRAYSIAASDCVPECVYIQTVVVARDVKVDRCRHERRHRHRHFRRYLRNRRTRKLQGPETSPLLARSLHPEQYLARLSQTECHHRYRFQGQELTRDKRVNTINFILTSAARSVELLNTIPHISIYSVWSSCPTLTAIFCSQVHLPLTASRVLFTVEMSFCVRRAATVYAYAIVRKRWCWFSLRRLV